jgi:hypothetical protein
MSNTRYEHEIIRLDPQEHIGRKIVTGLLVSGEFVKRVQSLHRDDLLDLLEYPELQTIARWCFEYFDIYGTVSKYDIEMIYVQERKHDRLDKALAQLIEQALSKISDDYQVSDINVEYLYDVTIHELRERRARDFSDTVEGLVKRGEIDEMETAIRSYQPLFFDHDDSLASVTLRRVSWLWRNRIPLGKVTLVVGRPDLGKSTVLCDMAARVSSGGQWPDDVQAHKRAVLMASAEDDYDDTIVPRLIAAGADLTMCYQIGRDAANISDLCQEIERRIPVLKARRQIVGAVTIDPLSSYLGGRVDAHNEAAVRVALRPLHELAAEHRIAIIALRHLRKGGSGPAIDQVSGSMAFIAAARTAYLVVRDQEDPTRVLFLHLKNNLAPPSPGLAYRLVGVEIPVRTRQGPVATTVGKVQWLDDEITISADEAVNGTTPKESKVEAAMEWLADVLSDGPVAQTLIEEAAKRDGVSIWTMRDAKKKMGVVSKQDRGFHGGWVWTMPTRQ